MPGGRIGPIRGRATGMPANRKWGRTPSPAVGVSSPVTRLRCAGAIEGLSRATTPSSPQECACKNYSCGRSYRGATRHEPGWDREGIETTRGVGAGALRNQCLLPPSIGLPDEAAAVVEPVRGASPRLDPVGNKVDPPAADLAAARRRAWDSACAIRRSPRGSARATGRRWTGPRTPRSRRRAAATRGPSDSSRSRRGRRASARGPRARGTAGGSRATGEGARSVRTTAVPTSGSCC